VAFVSVRLHGSIEHCEPRGAVFCCFPSEHVHFHWSMDVTGQRVDISLLHEKKSHGGDGQMIDTVEAFGKVKDRQHCATASAHVESTFPHDDALVLRDNRTAKVAEDEQVNASSFRITIPKVWSTLLPSLSSSRA
jgi:hypothetical protein